MSLTLDGGPLLSKQVTFSGNSFHLSAPIPASTTAGTHELCAIARSLQVCFEIYVCTSCRPRLGFLGQYGIASSSFTLQYPPNTQFTVIGDNFPHNNPIEIWIDQVSNILGSVSVPFSGRFQTTLTMPAGTTYGSHEITAAALPDPAGDLESSATLEVVRFIPL
jgi:hypothetical protein